MRLGAGEIVVILVLALLFFGPSKLPQLGSSLGEALRSFKKGLNSLREDMDVDASAEPSKSIPAESPKQTPTNAAAATPAEPKTPAK